MTLRWRSCLFGTVCAKGAVAASRTAARRRSLTWQEACRRLFPKSLTKLLNGRPAKVPKWLAKKWAPYYRLPLEKKLLGRKWNLSPEHCHGVESLQCIIRFPSYYNYTSWCWGFPVWRYAATASGGKRLLMRRSSHTQTQGSLASWRPGSAGAPVNISCWR